MASKAKKIAATATALALSATLLLGGTYAWQSVNQVALNEASDVVNPGGRLHDDFDGSNKDVYVENFATEPIFARVRLEEFFELVLNKGTAGETPVSVIGQKDYKTDEDGAYITKEDGTYEYDYTYEIFTDYSNGDSTNAGIDPADGSSYWTWTTGGSTVYMPTFNVNKDSLKADINGTYRDAVGGISDRDGTQYNNYVTYTEGQVKNANAIYDYDSNTADEIAQEDLAALINGTANANAYSDNVKLVEEEHIADNTLNASLISMADWLAMIEADGYDENTHGNYWVYDTDGWVYWSAPIEPKTATGLLLNGIELNQVMDDSWYYAINVVAQFITADDMGQADGTGFYDTSMGTAPSSDALTLLDAIGVDVDGAGNTDAEILELMLDYNFTNTVYPTIGQGIRLTFDIDSIPEDDLEAPDNVDTSSIKIHYDKLDEDSDEPMSVDLEDNQYTYENGILTITDDSLDGQMLYVRDGSGWVLGGTIDLSGDGGDDNYEDDNYLGDSNILVNNQEPDEEGYIYLSDLDIEQDNSFTVAVNEDAVTLAENGLTATFHENNITNTTLVVEEEDPYRATLTIAARDYHSVTITAKYDDGTEESVIVVPLYESIIVTPDMDGETLILPSGYYVLLTEDFEGNVSWALDGANRSMIYENEGAKYLSISSYESGTNITLTASDENETATVNIVVKQNYAYDGPTYSYYIKGSGDTWSYSLMPKQEYYWNQSADKSYELTIGMTNDFANDGGQVAITLEGLQMNDDGSYAAGFIGEDETLTDTATSQTPAGISVTEAQTQPFTIKVDITGINTDKYLIGEYQDEIYIYPVPGNFDPIRSVSVDSEDTVYEEVADEEYGDVLYIAPGESAEAELGVVYLRTAVNKITNADLTWSLTSDTDNFSITPDGDDALTATITHNCADADSCSCSYATKVKAQINGMDYEFTSSFTIWPEDDSNPDDDEDEYVNEVTRDGNLTLNLSDNNNYLSADETVSISIEDYDDMSLFDWTIMEGEGTYAEEGQNGVFTHYPEYSDEWNSCGCTTKIKATLKEDDSIWGSVSFPCA